MSANQVHVHPLEPFEHEGWLRYSARVEGLPDLPESLWFDLDPAQGDMLTELADPFVLGLLFTVLSVQRPLHVHGNVSFGLLQNLEYFQATWHSWVKDRYRPVEISADAEVTPEPRGGHAISAFSGGLDSAYTVRRHALGAVGRRSLQLRAGVMILGFDIRLDQEDFFHRAAEGSRIMLESLDMELWKVRTNFRKFRANWFHAHGSGLAAVLHCFAGGCSKALVASSAYHSGHGRSRPPSDNPVGSHVLTDPLFSSPLMEIIHDGAETGRAAKPVMIADWPEGMERLRVCWETATPDSNCGTCTKCIITKLAFLANGLPVPGSLSPPPTYQEIAGLRFAKSYQFRFCAMLLEIAEQNGLGGEYFCEAVRDALRKSRLREALSRLRIRR